MDVVLVGLAFASLAAVGAVAAQVMVEPPENHRSGREASPAAASAAAGPAAAAEEGIRALQELAPDGRSIRVLVSPADRKARVMQSRYVGPVIVCEPASLTGLETAFRAESLDASRPLPLAHATLSVRHAGLACHPSSAPSAHWVAPCTLRLGRLGPDSSQTLRIAQTTLIERDITCQPDVLYLGTSLLGHSDVYMEREGSDVFVALV